MKMATKWTMRFRMEQRVLKKPYMTYFQGMTDARPALFISEPVSDRFPVMPPKSFTRLLRSFRHPLPDDR